MTRTATGPGRSLGGAAIGVAAAALAGVAGADDVAVPTCVAAFVIEAVPVPAGADATDCLTLGGISDLCFRPSGSAAGRLWAITDRGPNGEVKTPSGSRRSLLFPEFSPCVVELAAAPIRAACTAAPPHSGFPPPANLDVAALLPLRTRSGRPASGRPTVTGREAPIVDHASGAPLPPDPDGIDSEAVVALADGTFWIAEEYGPSLVHVDAEGRMLARLVPAGGAVPGADADISAVLPEAYARRRDNRGFETLATLDGDRLLVAMLQSPPETAAAGRGAANVPLLVIDAVAKLPVAEHMYRAGHPDDSPRAALTCPPDDVKLCAMSAAGDGGLLVLEQGADGSAILYSVELTGATNTLPLRHAVGAPQPAEPPPEAIVDLEAAGIVPVVKRRVADVGPFLPQWRADARLEANAPLKLEGLALLDERHVALVNDDDFGVRAGSGAESPRSCLWIVRLAEPVTRPTAAAISR